MNPMEAFLQELEFEADSTRRILASAPEDHYVWRPHEKGKSRGELCGHIAEAPLAMTQVLDGESFDISARPGPSDPPADRAQTLARFEEGVAAATAWLGSLGDRSMDTWRLTRGEEELMAMPRASAVRFFLFNHLYHHRGQLSTYLRSVGAIVPPVYGPTADIDPFAVDEAEEDGAEVLTATG